MECHAWPPPSHPDPVWFRFAGSIFSLPPNMFIFLIWVFQIDSLLCSHLVVFSQLFGMNRFLFFSRSLLIASVLMTKLRKQVSSVFVVSFLLGRDERKILSTTAFPV